MLQRDDHPRIERLGQLRQAKIDLVFAAVEQTSSLTAIEALAGRPVEQKKRALGHNTRFPDHIGLWHVVEQPVAHRCRSTAES